MSTAFNPDLFIAKIKCIEQVGMFYGKKNNVTAYLYAVLYQKNDQWDIEISLRYSFSSEGRYQLVQPDRQYKK
jgi:hypothetical protein